MCFKSSHSVSIHSELISIYVFIWVRWVKKNYKTCIQRKRYSPEQTTNIVSESHLSLICSRRSDNNSSDPLKMNNRSFNGTLNNYLFNPTYLHWYNDLSVNAYTFWTMFDNLSPEEWRADFKFTIGPVIHQHIIYWNMRKIS